MSYELSSDKDLIGPWVCDRIGKVWGPEGREALGLVRDDKVVAGVVYENYTGASIEMHVAFQWTGIPFRKLAKVAFSYPFYGLGVERVFGLINSNNQKALRLSSRLGFRAEAVIEGVYPDGDMVIMVLERKNCWLSPSLAA